ncbi:hypothetical protein F511_31998 [Dorcoceras hygrometricum]|uniref:Uncharacterized protein n=1 Tax=Dorcoceras hygrometricum TaxID=472368 RepID=A0A2Z7D017_9LAMI|nr:hypothetical protein F511_31998 [Dorcoceras hygrometricum]
MRDIHDQVVSVVTQLDEWKLFRTEPSANRDLMSIRRLECELLQAKEIYRGYRVQAGLFLEDPESSVLGDTSNAEDTDVTGGRLLFIGDNSSENTIVQSPPAQESSAAQDDTPVKTTDREESSCTEESDTESYVKYDFQQFKKVFHRKMDDLLATLSQAQTLMESRILWDMNANHQKLSDEVSTLSSQMAELVDCLKKLGAAKRGENIKKRRLL